MPRSYHGVDLLAVKDPALLEILREMNLALLDMSRQLSSNQPADEGDTGSGGLPTEPYLTVGNSPNLSKERAIGTTSPIVGTDGGANGTYSISAPTAVVSSAAITANQIPKGVDGTQSIKDSEWSSDASGHLLPDGDATQNIGSATKNVNDVHLGGQIIITDAQKNIDSSVAVGSDAVEVNASDVLANTETQNIAVFTGADGTAGASVKYVQIERARPSLPTRRGRIIVGAGTASALNATSWIRPDQWTFSDNGTADGTDPKLKLTADSDKAQFTTASTVALEFISGIAGAGTVTSGPGVAFDIDGSDAGSPVANDANFSILKTNDDATNADFINTSHVGSWGASSRYAVFQDGSGTLGGISQRGEYFTKDTTAAFVVTNVFTSSSSLTADRTLTIDMENADQTVATIAGTQTLTNKTLTSPSIATPLFTDKVKFTQADGNEYIDSLTDGELDLEATTSVNLRVNTVEQVQVVDGVLQPSTTNDIDLGTSSLKFKDSFFSGNISRSTSAGITASTTQTQGQQPLTEDVNEVSVVANVNDTVTLPSAVEGLFLTVINNGANTLQIFPASGDNAGAGVNTAITLASGAMMITAAYDATNWKAISAAYKTS